jgi:predicted lipoprotein with Yx(FWY)xxD motif
MLLRIFAICFLLGFGLGLVAFSEAIIARRQARTAMAAQGFELIALDRDRTLTCGPGQWPYAFTATRQGALVAGGVCAEAWRGTARVSSIVILR